MRPLAPDLTPLTPQQALIDQNGAASIGRKKQEGYF